MVFHAPTGAEIFVGRNAAQNNALTRSAGGGDIWMHADGPGAHVILKATAGGPDPRDLKFAADLAVYWSKARGAKAEVTVAMVADVSTRRDGSAAVRRESKSMIGRPLATAPTRA
jgi:predicted ribosome quality control (RQC) complex YloA/Tae2 family protein